ncbi:MAG: tetratricopeptide repeat protein [Bacteroidota bacterium]
MIGDNDLLLIEDYLDDQLSGVQRQQFEQRLAKEPELAAELKIYRKMNQHLETQVKVNKQKEWKALLAEERGKQQSAPPARLRRMYYIASAAAAVLLLVAFFFLLPGPSNPDLAEAYWGESAAFFSTLTERGEAPSSPDNSQAYQLFEQGQYKSALEALRQAGPLSEVDLLLQGAAHFQLQQSDEAIRLFQQLLDDPNTLSKDEARWCLALAYLQKDQVAQARPLLQQIIDQQAWNWKPATRLMEEMGGR